MSKTIELSIQGMTCGHCVKAVEEALRSVDGVEQVEVSIGKARVQARDGMTLDALAAVLDDAGYELAS